VTQLETRVDPRVHPRDHPQAHPRLDPGRPGGGCQVGAARCAGGFGGWRGVPPERPQMIRAGSRPHRILKCAQTGRRLKSGVRLYRKRLAWPSSGSPLIASFICCAPCPSRIFRPARIPWPWRMICCYPLRSAAFGASPRLCTFRSRRIATR